MKKEQMTELAQRLLSEIESGYDFLKGEVPIFLEEVLTFYFWERAILSILFLFLTLVGIFFIWKGVKYWGSDTEKYVTGRYTHRWSFTTRLNHSFLIGGIGISLVSLVLFIASLHDFLMVTLAPRLFLLEWATYLVK